MSKLKSNKKKPRVSLNPSIKTPNFSFPVFNFRHLTLNDKYTFDGFKASQVNEKGKKAFELFVKLKMLSEKTWLELSKMNKSNGYETLEYSRINFTPNELELKKDEKIHVFRFCHDQCRIIGYKSRENTNILFIIGYDFDFSAYNHG